MSEIFHEGELLIQSRARVREIAEQLGEMIQTSAPRILQQFLSSQPMAVCATSDANGRVWASLLVGAPGFLNATEGDVLRITPRFREGDPVLDNLRHNSQIGVLVIEPATRRRARINGVATSIQPEEIVIKINQVYPNCTKYIQARAWTLEAGSNHTESIRGHALTARQQQWIGEADTFFIASRHSEQGADASHRGGRPGFITVTDGNRLQWPDYKGNSMFQTLGNLALNPAAGLLFLDWERNATLQLSGSANVVWDQDRIAQFAGAERLVEFQVTEIIEISGGLPLQWRFLNAYPYNPR